MRDLRRAGLLAATLLGIGLLGACDHIEPAEATFNDPADCLDCPPGLFSGEDGVLTIAIPVQE